MLPSQISLASRQPVASATLAAGWRGCFGEEAATLRLADDRAFPCEAVDGGAPPLRQDGALALTLDPGTTRVLGRG